MGLFNFSISLIPLGLKSNLFSITFSPAAETCSYVPDSLHRLKSALSIMLHGQLGNEAYGDDDKNYFFAHTVSQAELDVRGIAYQDRNWTGDFNTNIQFAGRQYSGNNYLEKESVVRLKLISFIFLPRFMIIHRFQQRILHVFYIS